MNLFVSSYCPILSAKALDDLRLNKMCIETAQLLSTAVHNGALRASGEVYRRAYPNHPVTRWVFSSPEALWWTIRHFRALLSEYQLRRGRVHGSSRILDALVVCDEDAKWISPTPSSYCNCTPHKDLPIIDAYRKTLQEKWLADIRYPRWTNSSPPDWSFHDYEMRVRQ